MRFTQRLVTFVGEDAIVLALMNAANAEGVSRDEAERVLKTLLQYQKDHSPFPPGFM